MPPDPTPTPTPDPTPAPTPPPARGFKLHPLNALGFGLIILTGVLMLVVAASRGGDPERIGEAAGRLFGMLLLPLALGWGGYRSAGRSSRAGNAVLGAILAIMLVSIGAGVVSAFRNDRDAKTSAKLAEAKAMADRSRRSAADGDAEGAMEQARDAATKLREAASGASGVDKAVLEYAASTGERRNDRLARYIAAIQAFNDKGGMDPDRLTDLPTLEAGISELAAVTALQDVVLKDLSGAADDARRELAALGAPQREIDSFLNGMNRDGRLDKTIAFQRCERSVLDAMARRLALLKKHHGHWQVGESGAVKPAPEVPAEDADELDGFADAIEALVSRQEELQRSLR